MLSLLSSDDFLSLLQIGANFVRSKYFDLFSFSLLSMVYGWNATCLMIIKFLFNSRTIRLVHVMRLHRQDIDKIENESSVALKRLEAKEQMEKISIIRLTLDFVHATSTLPTGWLWGGKFSNYTVGLIGTTSSFIGLYQYFAKKRLAKN